MKKIFKLSALLPVMALAAGCSDDKMADQFIEGDFTVVMSIRTDETRANDETHPDDAINPNRVYFGTYKIDGSGALMHSLYEGGRENEALSATYFTPWWGPSVSAKLPKNDYKNGFFTGIFSVPAYANATFKLGSIGDIQNFQTIKWPVAADAGSTHDAWVPSDKKQIPMAGIAKVDKDFMDGYLDYIHYNSPLNLPTTEMVRAMAKIVIVDKVEGGIIGKVDLESLLTGYLTPQPAAWFNGTLLPYSPSATGNTFTQTLSAPNGTNVDGNREYVFYTFERDFSGVKAGDDARKVITLTAKDSYNLPAAKKTMKVSFAPYSDNNVYKEDEVPTDDNWKGILRNHVYTFNIYEPPTGGIQIQVSAASFGDPIKEEFNF